MAEASDIAKRRIVYAAEDDIEITVRHEVPYRTTETDTLTFDLYRPTSAVSPLPVVLFVIGFSDVGTRAFVGCNAKDMQCYVSWASLMAKSGLAAVTYTTTAPTTDVHDLLHHLRREQDALGIDTNRLGVWACSGNVPNALGLLMSEDSQLRCAALCYGYMLDLDGATAVADATKTFRFTNPCEARQISDLSRVPLLIVRAGRDQMPNLNATIDRFVAKALDLNFPLTFINHAEGPHAFDLFDDSEDSRKAIRQILDFIQVQLAGTG